MNAHRRKYGRAPPKSRNRCYGISDHGCLGYSALMLAARITLPHFLVSSAINFPKSVGVIGIGEPPRSAILAFIVGSASPALISLLSVSMISAGVFLGAPRPNHPLAS